MKKGLIKKLGVAAVSVVMLMTTACNTKIDAKFDVTALDYVTLGQYKGLEVTVDTSSIENALMEKRIVNDQKDNITYTDVSRAAQDTDKVIMDFTGSIGGVEQAGFSSEAYEMILGTDEFVIDGFVDALYGMTAGQTKIITLTIPDDFEEQPLYAGQRIVYEISMTNVQQANVPMITDAYAKQYYNCDTVKDYRAKIKAELQEEIDKQVNQAKQEAVIAKLEENATVNSYPEEFLATRTEELDKSISFYSIMQGFSNDEYCQQRFGVTFEEYVKNSVAVQLSLQAVAETEGITITEYEYKAELEGFASDNGFSDKETFVERYGKDKIVTNMILQRAQDLIMENALITEI